MSEVLDHPAAVTTSTRHHVTCQRCGKAWDAYVQTPKVCRFCKNPAWNVPKDAILPCPVAGCHYEATGARARVKLAKHVQNTADVGHGQRYAIPPAVQQRLNELAAASAAPA